jgi:hypothetical protein
LESLSLTTTTFILQEQLEQQLRIGQNNVSAFPPGFVTIPDTEHHLGHVREATQAHVLAYVPVVTGKHFDRWAEYAEINKGWMADAYKVNPTGDKVADSIIQQGDKSNSTMPYIWHLHLQDDEGKEIDYDFSSCGDRGGQSRVPTEIKRLPEDPTDGTASPIWLLSPPPNPESSNRINYNMRSGTTFESAVQTIAEHRSPTFQDICTIPTVRIIVPLSYTDPVFGGFENLL